MNVILLTVLALHAAPGANGAAMSGAGQSGYSADGGYGDYGGECDECEGHGHGGRRGERERCLGPMPQSCYMPSFGCYHNSRFMHRYPAFHGTYYRKAYNYRNYFDYPWHAGLHEPTSHFSYHVPGERSTEGVPSPAPDAALNNLDRSYQANLLPTPAVEARPAAGQSLRTLRR